MGVTVVVEEVVAEEVVVEVVVEVALVGLVVELVGAVVTIAEVAAGDEVLVLELEQPDNNIATTARTDNRMNNLFISHSLFF